MVTQNKFKISKGSPSPLGANPTKSGVNFAIASDNAKSIFLCLFSKNGKKELQQIELQKTGNVFHSFVPKAKEGQLYGYRVDGEYNPEKGLRFNKNKLLIDPYAKELTGKLIQSIDNHDNNDTNNAHNIPKGVVISENFDWKKSRKPKTPLSRTFIYESHIKGMTMLHPDVPKKLRGTFKGMCHPAIIKHLKDLGITSVELLPIHSFVSEDFLEEKGLSNYWGYNTINFFSVHNEYGSINDFKSLVRTYHENGLEVIMDVVFNHTCEGNHEGPTYSFKGIDNPSYYMLSNEDKTFYNNDTGCGNTFNTDSKIPLKLIWDSLRYFSEDCQVDGFRFDLATTLTRDLGTIDKSRFLEFIRLDKKLSSLKMIAEPWDIGHNGYQLGRFRDNFCEWNDEFRGAVRNFWKGSKCQINKFSGAITGSENIFRNHDNQALSSINFITAHDGFTLQDLVSYNEKHNEANLEDNRDGNDNHNSCNNGAEGYTDDTEINNIRMRQKKNLMMTNILSKGVPMILSGDEIGNSQNGNNNAYCQDNEIGWVSWDKTLEQDWKFYNFVKQTIEFRLKYDKLINEEFLNKDNAKWYSTTGQEMSWEDWDTPYVKCLTLITNNNTIFMFNSHTEDVEFNLPFVISGEIVFNSNEEESFTEKNIENTSSINIPNRSITILRIK